MSSADLQFAFCEPVSATTVSKEHIRLVGPEGLKLGGGVPAPTLCGRDLRGGWDLRSPVTEVRMVLDAEVNPTCPACVAEWRNLTA